MTHPNMQLLDLGVRLGRCLGLHDRGEAENQKEQQNGDSSHDYPSLKM
jgi:hypothetical protein